MITLHPAPLTREAFAPFGDVIEKDGANHFPINNGTTERYHDLALVDIGADSGGRTLINIFHARPLKYPLSIKLVERHPLGSQAFIPLCNHPFYVIVAKAGDAIQASALQAFVTNGHQGVNYHKGVWHHPVMAQGQPADFIVIDRGGEGKNCEEACFTGEAIYFNPT